MPGGLLPSLASLRPEGPAARSIAGLWWLMLALGGAVYVLVVVLLVVGLFRRRAPGERHGTDAAPPERPGRWILLGGVAMPSVVLVAVLVATVRTMGDIRLDAPPGSPEIEVVGHQWWWEIRYPGDGTGATVTANELHLPVGRPVVLRLHAADVIHSFWVPALAGKLDLLPDGTNTLVVQADEPGVHRSECAEFCGLQHANMGLVVVAEPADRFEAWLAGQRADATAPAAGGAPAQGAALFTSEGCAGCHAVRGATTDGAGSGPTAATPAPDLTHFGGRLELGGGVAPNTADALRRWITDPHAMKEGIAMPASDLDPAEVDAIVAYLGSLT